MEQLASVWSSLSMRRRVIVAAATLTMFAAVLALSRAATAPSLALLYSGLEPAAAGEVIAALEQRGVAFEVRNGAIYAEASARDQLRMSLAAEGLPAAGGAGYELLDSLSGFGTTSQMFDAAYWRAKEGELARTIASGPAVRSARVHLAGTVSQGFRRDVTATASVAVVPAGDGLSAQHARAIRYLVASAVAGLRAEDVSVIDAESGLLLGADDGIPAGDSDRTEALKRNVERLLEARVGAGRAIVEVSIETLTEREAITERRFDPESRVAISTDSEERTTQSNDSRNGAVTVASNLPDGDAAPAEGGSSSRDSEARERINYEVSETQREIVRQPGGIRRLTVAVLVDGVEVTDAAGATTQEPRPDAELAALRELVASAVGFDEARGDVITLKSMPFGATAALGAEATGSLLDRVDPMSTLQVGLLALVALILGLFVVRPVLVRRRLPDLPSLPGPAGSAGSAGRTAVGNTFELPSPGVGASERPQVFDGEIEDAFDGRFPTVNAALPRLPGDTGGDAEVDPNDPVSRLRRLISERQDETAEILRSWMDDREERA